MARLMNKKIWEIIDSICKANETKDWDKLKGFKTLPQLPMKV